MIHGILHRIQELPGWLRAAQGHAGATNALLVTLLVPPVAILLGALLLNEIIEPRDFAGMGLIALGLAAIDGRLLSLLERPTAYRQAA